MWKWIKHGLESLRLQRGALVRVKNPQRHEKVRVWGGWSGYGAAGGCKREEYRPLGLERARRAFCQTKGSSSEWRVLQVWQTAGQCRDTRSGYRPASSTAWCAENCPCKRVSFLSWAALGTQRDKDSEILASEGKGWESAIDGDKNIIFLKTFPRLASAPIHMRPQKGIS